MGGLGGLSGLGLNSNPSPAPQDSRDRIRNVWDSIRERVGLNSNSRGNGGLERAADDGSGAATPVGSSPRMRPGEMMLAEMARALNAGLGLASNANNAARENRQEPTNPAHVLFPPIADSNSSLPPEGSFERFLANLQTDLRTILSEEPAITVSQSANAPAEPGTDSIDPEESDHPQATQQTVSRPGTPIPLVEVQHDDEHTENDDEPPPLSADVDSDDDDSFHDADDTGSDDDSDRQTITDHPPRTPTPIPSALPQDQANADAAGPRRRERPAINLWRIYRFDPIPAMHAQSQTASPLQVNSNPSPLREFTTETSPPSSPTLASGEGNEARPDTPHSSRTDGPQPSSQVVVPVIVVGLQSVDVVDADEPEDEAPSMAPRPSSPTDQPPEDASRPTTPRGRRWPSRAANALRTWRPGRRGSRARRNADGTGSRTFLIYVIGGMCLV